MKLNADQRTILNGLALAGLVACYFIFGPTDDKKTTAVKPPPQQVSEQTKISCTLTDKARAQFQSRLDRMPGTDMTMPFIEMQLDHTANELDPNKIEQSPCEDAAKGMLILLDAMAR